MNNLSEFVIHTDPLIFKNKIYDDINIENALKMNQVLLKIIFASESTQNLIKAKSLYKIICNKMGLKIK